MCGLHTKDPTGLDGTTVDGSFCLIKMQPEPVVTITAYSKTKHQDVFKRDPIGTKIGHRWLKSILTTRPPCHRRVVLIFQRGGKTGHQTEAGWQEPQAACGAGNRRLALYPPERAGGRWQHGSGRTCIRQVGPRWCRWGPDATASPPFCHCRVRARVRWVPRKSRWRSQTQRRAEEGRVAAKMCSRQSGSWLHRQREGKMKRSKATECIQCEVCSPVLTVSASQWLLESKQMVKWCRGQSSLRAPQCFRFWMNKSDGEINLICENNFSSQWQIDFTRNSA